MVLSPVRQWGIGSLAPPRVTACTSPAWRPLADRPVVVLSSVGQAGRQSGGPARVTPRMSPAWPDFVGDRQL